MVDILDPETVASSATYSYELPSLLLRFLANLLITGGIIRYLYYPRSKRKDYFSHLYTDQYDHFHAPVSA